MNGLSLVAKEIAKRSQALESAATGDFEALITSTAKKALVSVTDISGLTRGKVREVSTPRPKESVAYFDRPEPSQVQSQSESINDNVVVEEKVFEVNKVSCDKEVSALERDGECEDRNLEDKSNAGGEQAAAAGATTETAMEAKRRKPRERRVPSTPFSRALG